jgi:hypothetical protein
MYVRYVLYTSKDQRQIIIIIKNEEENVCCILDS